ncbi:Uncharacterised protein [Corynebacterium kutscheri]|uniref:Uncharacterized protein n=1 Tax=Corynebacterium kutscheri TaxID=35755 RepID=A0AB38VY13_9CORY|nr:Uncharacterised protein [Corynebacterium kutscheri]VEH79508.1 Uncharacterised protein [Corynebacterium kutscheri]
MFLIVACFTKKYLEYEILGRVIRISLMAELWLSWLEAFARR